jgi:hypothetical protein
MSRIGPGLVFVVFLSGVGRPAAAQDSTWQAIKGEGVLRASAIVDSVFIDKQIPRATVAGGDFTAYLMARLGVNRIPPDFNYRVKVDSSRIRLGGTLADLPREAHAVLDPLFLLLAPDTHLVAEVTLTHAGPRAEHFRLESVLIEGVAIPDNLLQPVMAGVGQQYPALTSSGRDLYVEIPAGARITLLPDSVGLTGP